MDSQARSAAHTEKDDVMLTCNGCGQSFPSDGLYAHIHGGCPCDEDYSNGIPTLTIGSDWEEAQTWLVQVFSFHADYIARDGGVRLPSGWEPLRIEATGGNKYRVYARKQEVAT